MDRSATLYVGEFGSLSRDGDRSSTALVSDMIDVFNRAGYAWTIWCYRGLFREPGSSAFDFGLINCLDDRSPDVGYAWRRELSDPWSKGLKRWFPAAPAMPGR